MQFYTFQLIRFAILILLYSGNLLILHLSNMNTNSEQYAGTGTGAHCRPKKSPCSQGARRRLSAMQKYNMEGIENY